MHDSGCVTQLHGHAIFGCGQGDAFECIGGQ
jgi:hypothetical protein